jgi:hypothetical protein
MVITTIQFFSMFRLLVQIRNFLVFHPSVTLINLLYVLLLIAIILSILTILYLQVNLKNSL